MHVGKTLFAQVMEFVPWTSFARIVDRHSGNAGARTLSCAGQFRAMAFAQLTWRESLRDIEASLSANAAKLYAMGFRSAVRRSTLADANELRDWHIWADLAAVLIRRARKLYANDSLGVELDNTVYALDSSTIDLCLSLFEWAPFRLTKAAIKLHTLLDLRGAIPAFVHISDGKLHDVNVLDMLALEAGAFYVMDRGYLDFSRLYTLHQAGAFFVTRAKSPMDARRVYSATTDHTAGVVRCGHLRAHRHRQEGASTRCLALHAATDSLSVDLRKNATATDPYRRCSSLKQPRRSQPAEFARGLTDSSEVKYVRWREKSGRKTSRSVVVQLRPLGNFRKIKS